MNRRKYLLSLLGLGFLSNRCVPAPENPIQLHVDLDVLPDKEQEMVENFRQVFRPAISNQPGFVEVRLLRLREVVVGPVSEPANYRLLISFGTEDQRKQWVASDAHQSAWPTIERTLKQGKFTASLYDVI
jgi:heme-degrading monooxygenase HmoA